MVGVNLETITETCGLETLWSREEFFSSAKEIGLYTEGEQPELYPLERKNKALARKIASSMDGIYLAFDPTAVDFFQSAKGDSNFIRSLMEKSSAWRFAFEREKKIPNQDRWKYAIISFSPVNAELFVYLRAEQQPMAEVHLDTLHGKIDEALVDKDLIRPITSELDKPLPVSLLSNLGNPSIIHCDSEKGIWVINYTGAHKHGTIPNWLNI